MPWCLLGHKLGHNWTWTGKHASSPCTGDIRVGGVGKISVYADGRSPQDQAAQDSTEESPYQRLPGLPASQSPSAWSGTLPRARGAAPGRCLHATQRHSHAEALTSHSHYLCAPCARVLGPAESGAANPLAFMKRNGRMICRHAVGSSNVWKAHP